MKQSDIAAMLQRKRDINASANKSLTSLTMERSRLQQARTLAIRRQDYAEVAQIDAKLAELQANAPAKSREESSTDVLAKLNERNRRLNQEQVRKAERAEMERRRREKLARAGSGTATPTTAPMTTIAATAMIIMPLRVRQNGVRAEYDVETGGGIEPAPCPVDDAGTAARRSLDA